MKFLTHIVIIVLLNLVGITANAQEHLRPLSGNIDLQHIPAQQQTNKKVTSVTSIHLPFFDDFSYAYKYAYPSYNNWIDSNVYVNTGFAIAPISIGVATFDGLNKKGYPYYLTAPASYSGSSDTLTSRPIHLDTIGTHYYAPSDSIALTFYYQAEGFGDAPEVNDSLCVDFFKPLADTLRGTWTKVWGKPGYNPGSNDTGFYKVKLFITDTAYFHDGFQFRFRNKGRASGSLDHWHVDYVQIKQLYFFYDTTITDVAFAYKASSFLKNYSVMPFRQYDTTELANNFHNFFRNNNPAAVSANYSYSVRDQNNIITVDTSFVVDNPGLPSFATNGYFSGLAAFPGFYNYKRPFANINTFTDSTYYSIEHILTAGFNNDRKENDTLRHIQKFSNYYAYDDGTAEQAYYLGGNSFGAKMAVKFKLNVADTLKSVRIYFDPFTEGNLIQNAGFFRIHVWSGGGNSPGSILYKDSLMLPVYLKDSIIPVSGANKIPTYELTSCLPLPAGSYFIGIQQITGQPLNVGFDRNTNHKNNFYYNTTGNWVQSSINGSLMINPVMGCVDAPPIVGIHAYEKADKIKLYPNPAQNSIIISLPGNQSTTANLEITNALGQTAFTGQFTSNESIDISELSNGLYFIHIKGNGLNVSPQKLIISR